MNQFPVRTLDRAVVVALGVLLLGSTVFAEVAQTQPKNPLRREIEVIRSKWRPELASTVQGEKAMLALADQYTSAEDRGRIFYVLTNLYSCSKKYASKMGQYAEKALEYPQNVNETIQLQRTWGAAIETLNESASPETRDQAKRAAGQHYLKAYAVLLAALADPVPESVRREFGVIRRFSDERPPVSAAEIERHMHEREVLMRKARLEDDLARDRPYLVEQIARCFAGLADGPDELRRAARDVIEDATVVDELIATMKAVSTRPAATTRPFILNR